MRRNLLTKLQPRARRTLPAAGAAVQRLGSAATSAAAAADVAGESRDRAGYSLGALAAVGAAGVLGGIAIGDKDMRLRRMQLPPSMIGRACCDTPMTDSQKGLPDKLSAIVGSGYVKRNCTQKGSRLGKGTSVAHVSPGTLQEAVKVLEACVAAGVAIVPQGANTSLTGASVPRNEESDRPTVVLNLRRLQKIMPIGDGKQVLCFSGAGIFDLKDMLEKKYRRDSHSVLGSIFLNPTVAAGVAFGSGGTQIRKGPAWTERALFCKVKDDGSVELVNTLGLKDGGDAVKFLDGRVSLSAEDLDPTDKGSCSWPKYGEVVRAYDEPKVARYNADTTGPDCCRSEGKVMILATMHDTWDLPKTSKLVWVSCNSLDDAHQLKRQVALKAPNCMAKSCEYFNRETHNGVDRAGRILIKMIDIVGMQRLEPLWNLKLTIEMIPLPFTGIICDKFLYWFNNIVPHPLPQVLRDMGRDYEHNVLMEFGEYSDGEIDRLQAALDSFVKSRPEGSIKYHVCEGWESQRANLWRFVVAPAFRTFCIGVGMQGLSIDYALPKNYQEYPPMPEKEFPMISRWVYSHFGCNVYHEDIVYAPDVDVHAAKMEVKHSVEHTGGKLPAEHGHGTEYKAPAEMQERWRRTDPLNVMNPGIGGTSSFSNYAEKPAHLGCCNGAH